MKSQSYRRFWQKIHKVAESSGFPLRVMFELTYRCNDNCRHCWSRISPDSTEIKAELSFEEIKCIVDKAKVFGDGL